MNAEEILAQDTLELDDPKIFSMLLWNDETHTFDDVAQQCEVSIGCSSIEGRQIAKNVDAYVNTVFYSGARSIVIVCRC
jgi:hypothetical protein